jgi:hypothetical protein
VSPPLMNSSAPPSVAASSLSEPTGKPRSAKACPEQPPLLPHALPIGHATPGPLCLRRVPRYRRCAGRGDRAVGTEDATRAGMTGPPWLLGRALGHIHPQTEPTVPGLGRKMAQHCARVFLFLEISFSELKILENVVNF